MIQPLKAIRLDIIRTWQNYAAERRKYSNVTAFKLEDFRHIPMSTYSTSADPMISRWRSKHRLWYLVCSSIKPAQTATGDKEVNRSSADSCTASGPLTDASIRGSKACGLGQVRRGGTTLSGEYLLKNRLIFEPSWEKQLFRNRIDFVRPKATQILAVQWTRANMPIMHKIQAVTKTLQQSKTMLLSQKVEHGLWFVNIGMCQRPH